MTNTTNTGGVKYNLDIMKVDMEDVSYLSNYFVISELPSILTAGKTLFGINGSNLLSKTAPIYLEILDAKGNPLYYELAKSGYFNYRDTTDLAISISVNSDTEPGVGKIILVGTTTDNFKVRWQTNIKIDPSLENDSKVIFYNTPTVNVGQSIVYIALQSLLAQETQLMSGSIYGTPTVPVAYSDINTVNPKKTITNYNLTLVESSSAISVRNIDEPIDLYVDNISYLQSGNIITQSVNITQSFVIKDVINDSVISLDKPLTYYANNINQVVPIIHGNFSSSYVAINYITASQADDNTIPNKQLVFQNQASGSTYIFLKEGYLDVVYKNLRTFTGKVYRHKIYRRSLNKASDFECIADEPLLHKNIFVDDFTINRYYNEMGNYYNQTHINQYYYTSSGDITLTQDSSEKLDSMVVNVNPSMLNVDQSQYIIIKNNSSISTTSSAYIPYDETSFIDKTGVSYDSNFINFYKNSAYMIGGDIDLTSISSSSEAKLIFYLTGSYNFDLMQRDMTYVTDHGLKLAEYVIPAGQSRKKISVNDSSVFSFINDYIGTLTIVPVNISTAKISNLSINTTADYGFSPDVYITKVPFPVTIKNEQYEVTFELFDFNCNSIYSKLSTVVSFDKNGETLYKYIPNYVTSDTASISSILASGSLEISGQFISNAVGIGFVGTSSYAKSSSYALSASYAKSSSYALSASYALSSSYALSASYALSSSYALSASYALSSSHSLNSDTAISSGYATTAHVLDYPTPVVDGTYRVTGSVTIVNGIITAIFP